MAAQALWIGQHGYAAGYAAGYALKCGTAEEAIMHKAGSDMPVSQ